MRHVQSVTGMPSTHPGMEPSSGADPDLPPYKGRDTAACDGVRSAGFEPAVTWLSTRPVYLLRHEHMEPLARIERAASDLRGRRSAG